MNRRLYSIFILVTVLVFSANGNGHASGTPTGAHLSAHCSYKSIGVAHALPLSTDVHSKNKHPLKNIIRIKAWDDAPAMDIPPAFALCIRCEYREKPQYTFHSNFLYSRDNRVSALRGPPATA